jgi:probable F420-dependent oxidoreductase
VTVGVVLPYWLTRPDLEAVDIAVEADRLGYHTLWIGEMVTFDAFALATAIGLRTSRIGLKLGPLAVGVRSPVGLAFGLSSVAQLTGRRVDLALGASTPRIVAEWHGRTWEAPARRARESVRDVRALLDGKRVNGFKLRHPLPAATISVAAFGSAMTRLAAEEADEVVLNLVTPSVVAEYRRTVDAYAHAAGIRPPRIAVWVAAAVDPTEAALELMSSQVSLYLKAPGYAEMFARMGLHAGNVLGHVCALGTAAEVRTRIAAYHEAGADHVGVVPCTADDPAGTAVLGALAREKSER